MWTKISKVKKIGINKSLEEGGGGDEKKVEIKKKFN